MWLCVAMGQGVYSGHTRAGRKKHHPSSPCLASKGLCVDPRASLFARALLWMAEGGERRRKEGKGLLLFLIHLPTKPLALSFHPPPHA